MKDYEKLRVAEIVADNILTTQVLSKYGIDYLFGGRKYFLDAVKEAGGNAQEIIEALEKVEKPNKDIIDFKEWPLDLVCDYILKKYHRYIRIVGPQIQELLKKVVDANAGEHPSLFEVQELFEMSLAELYRHIRKEEQILFPYIYQLYNAFLMGAPAPSFHCGSIANPIEVMEIEHSEEGARYKHIIDLTGGYEAPEDASEDYKLVLKLMKEFNEALYEHINLENNVVFPQAIDLERKLVKA